MSSETKTIEDESLLVRLIASEADEAAPGFIIEVPRDVRPTEASLLAKIAQLEEELAEARGIAMDLTDADSLPDHWFASSPEGETD